MHMVSYEYEYFGSARTPGTDSSTRDHTASLFCFICTTYDEDVRIIRVRAKNKINTRIIRRKPTNLLRILLEKPCTTARIILENEYWFLSLPTAVSCGWQPQYQQRHACSRWFRDTLGLQEKAPSRGVRYLVNIANKFHVATRNTSSPIRMHALWNKDAQRKEGTTRTHGSMDHVSALSLVVLVYCSMLQQMGVEAKSPGNRRRLSEHDHMHAWYIR